MVGKLFFVFISLASCHGVLVPASIYLDEHCGGTINIEQYEQFRLRLTRNYVYQNSLKCEVTLETFPGWQLMVFYQSLSTEKDSNCTFDWVEIHDGNSRADGYITGERHCGNVPPSGVYNTSGQYMTVYFQSDESVEKHGFDVIITPYYRGDCSWTEHRCSNNRCIQNTLSCNGYNPCGDYSDCDTLPLVEPSVQPYNETNGTSDYNITTKYMDNWCGSFMDLDKGQIRLQLTSSPFYAKNISCQVTLRVNETQRIMFYFTDMDIEQSGSCAYDYLEIYDGFPTYAAYIDGIRQCGQIAPPGVLTTNGRYLTLYFHSDDSRQFRGFDMVITSFHTVQCISPDYRCNNGRCIPRALLCSDLNPCGDHSDCPVSPTTTSTTTSLYPITHNVFYLNEYCGERLNVEFYEKFRLRLARDPRHQPSLQCKVLLHTNRQNNMLITFTDLDIEGDCDNDWIELDDGSSRSDPYLAGGKKCGTSPPTGVYKTSGNFLTVYFESASAQNGTGFDMLIQPLGTKYMDGLCGKTLSIGYINQMRLKLTNNYSYLPNFRCQLTIKIDHDSRLMFYFQDLAIESPCSNDWLEIDDGRSKSDPYLAGGKQCGINAPSSSYTSSGRYMTLYFQSDSSVEYSGFDMTITSFHSGTCWSNEFQCRNGRCISADLRCNGRNPCGDYSDCTTTTTTNWTPRTYTDSHFSSHNYHYSFSVGAIVGIALGCTLVLTFLTVVISVACSRRKTTRNQYRREPQVATINSSDYATYGYTNPMAANYSEPPPSYISVLASATTNQGTTNLAAVHKQYSSQ